MDPQSVAFTPQSEAWRLSDTMKSFQQTQQDHAERLVRLERRQDGDARIKSVWGGTSAFPSGLSGTPTHGPQQSPQVDFSGFDDDESSNNMVRSLHLDVDDEPRRLNAGSRANSVRFDDSAKPGQWNHAPRGSVEALSRVSSGIGGFGGHPMFERTTSHKSDGRQSSAGQSASGRANSMGLEMSQTFGQSSADLPSLAPGLLLLGTVPSIIRCWLNMNFRHDTLLYAAVCTGSYRSYLDMKLIEQLGLSAQVRHDISGNRKIKLLVYLPEAISQPPTSRPSSPAPHLPYVTVDFMVIDRSSGQPMSKAIQIFIGSDTLRLHNADVMLSINCVNMMDDDRNKLSVPLVRPENDETFKTLCTTSVPVSAPKQPIGFNSASQSTQDLASLARSMSNGFDSNHRQRAAEVTPPGSEAEPTKEQTPDVERVAVPEPLETVQNEALSDSADGQSHDRKPHPINTSLVDKEAEDSSGTTSATRITTGTGTSPAIWSSWRRDGSSSASGDWASTSRNASSTYQRPGRDAGGIKVLKPASARQPSRSGTAPSQSTSTGQSRFFDEGRRRAGPTGNAADDVQALKPSTSREESKSVQKEIAPPSAAPPASTKTRSANPIGGASAFGWLNSVTK